MADDQFKDPRQPAETERKDDDPFAELARIVGFDEDEKKAKEAAVPAPAAEPADLPPPTVDIPLRAPFTAPIPTIDVPPRHEPVAAVKPETEPAPPPPQPPAEGHEPPQPPPVASHEPPPPPLASQEPPPPPLAGHEPPPPPTLTPLAHNEPVAPSPVASHELPPVTEDEAALDLEAELLRELEIDVGEQAEESVDPPVASPPAPEIAAEPVVERPQSDGPSFFDPPVPPVDEPATQPETQQAHADPLSALLDELPGAHGSAADPVPEMPAESRPETVPENPWPGAAKADDSSVSSLEAELEAAFSALEDSGPAPGAESDEEAKAQIDAAVPPAETISESEELASAYRKFEEDVQAAMPKATQLDETPDDINDALLAEMADVEAEAAAAAAPPPPPEVPFDHASIADSDEVPEAMAELDVPEIEPEEVVPAPSAEADFGLPLEEELEALASEAAGAAGDAGQQHDPLDIPPSAPEPEDLTAVPADPASFEAPAADDTVEAIGLTEEELAEHDGTLGEDDGFAMDDDLLVPEFDSVAEPDHGQSGRRGLVAALVVLGVAVAGGGGFYFWNSSLGGNSTSDAAPVIVADSEPVKVKPENPGGKTVPNQDLAVYDRVAGNDTAAPQEQNLVTTTEEPVDVVQRTLEPGLLPLEGRSDTAEPVVKSEDRLTASDTSDNGSTTPEETVAIAPRKVRTLVVKPDGTIVARELPATSQPSVTETAGGASATSDTTVSSTQPTDTTVDGGTPSNEVTASNDATTATGDGDQPRQIALAPAESSESATTTPLETAAVTNNATNVQTQPSSTEPVQNAAETDNDAGPPPIDENLRDSGAIPLPVNKPVSETAGTEVAATTTSGGNANARAPVPSARPSEQPVTIVEAVNERGNLAGGSASGTPGGYSMQISSQPSEAGARESYQNLSRRYASIIGGRGVNIQRADIPNKGVFYRVRIPVGSRADATALCNQYKAAGGSCFVAR